ncbi:predicted protein [Phaeodactylum tricornutum CCAP 1055/1]|uniref:Uncharacterized protein n=1 Tax=Phaeodactylum tricornutum (strain CCAP 1055/1) TaxID=556484 RepID=B7FRF6_PHATC|nr:predicted protein [Phaeodactylum tricornutum CCAP 1055/1]EEC50998.1 predicted protein [Phaeodactylum tricornutum CCAP 1055/1]|eukprot:XP_002176535.1 predicted protein [Phaeodactylum tricornutum CCAP 1055/1]
MNQCCRLPGVLLQRSWRWVLVAATFVLFVDPLSVQGWIPNVPMFQRRAAFPRTTITTTSSPAAAAASIIRVSLSPTTTTGSPDPSQGSTLPPPSPSLEAWETWCVERMATWYHQALSIKCPFFRRRASDALDTMDEVLRFVIARHKSLDVTFVLGPPAGWRCDGDVQDKCLRMETEDLMTVLQADWQTDTNKGYYITGRLNTAVYRDDCLFDGPDPDMPVRGLRKYLNAASQLFDPRTSRATLLSLEEEKEDGVLVTNDVDKLPTRIVAKWEMRGILRLPWKPSLPTWTGTTTYVRDADGLIYQHLETWDMSVGEAFLRTLAPDVAARIWKE